MNMKILGYVIYFGIIFKHICICEVSWEILVITLLEFDKVNHKLPFFINGFESVVLDTLKIFDDIPGDT